MFKRNKVRYGLTVGILFVYSMFLILMAGNSYDPTPAFLFMIVFTPVVAYLLGMIWRYQLVALDADSDHTAKNQHGNQEKRKRQALDDVLRDLSDDELYVLRQRLQDGTVDDDVLQDRLLQSDGELRNRQR